MCSSRSIAVAFAVFLTSCLATPAFAWGPDGHRIVCRIAYQLLDAGRRQEVDRLTSLYRTPTGGQFTFFTEGCLFPDTARARAQDGVPGWERFAPFERWHFLNAPRETHRIDDGHCNGDCVLTGISRHAELLGTAVSDEERAEALFFLGHWVGDIHQPLHISYMDDRGGNHVKPINGGFYSSDHLHGVWDSGIIGKAIGTVGWRIYADRLAREITPAERATWIAAPEISWAQESYNLSTRPKTEYCAWREVEGTLTCRRIGATRTLVQSYQDEFEDEVELRLQQAGARLAALLTRHLAVP